MDHTDHIFLVGSPYMDHTDLIFLMEVHIYPKPNPKPKSLILINIYPHTPPQDGDPTVLGILPTLLGIAPLGTPNSAADVVQNAHFN